MTPEQARAAANLLAQQLQNEWMTTYKVLNAIPEGSFDEPWQAPPDATA